jgi:hypothetical protein
MSGADRVLTLLADPWTTTAVGPHADGPAPAPVTGGAVVARPRVTEGRVVVRRAAWTMPVDAVPWPTDGQDDADLLRCAERWRRTHDLPHEVYVRISRTALTMDPAARKPVWLDLRSPHAWRHVAAMVGPDAVGVELVEALPARGQQWLRDPDGRPRTVEHIELVRWPDADVAAPATSGASGAHDSDPTRGTGGAS